VRQTIAWVLTPLATGTVSPNQHWLCDPMEGSGCARAEYQPWQRSKADHQIEQDAAMPQHLIDSEPEGDDCGGLQSLGRRSGSY
jgi:hypothetical protein